MAFNFLPFITEKSSDLSVFKAIVQRTKGLSVSNAATLFSLILNKGITEVRVKLDKYPEELTASQKISELLSQHSEYAIPKSSELFWYFVLKNEEKDKNSSTAITFLERSAMFAVLAFNRTEKLKDAGFDVDISFYIDASEESFDANTSELPVLFSSSCEKRIGFTCWEEFKAYVMYRSDKTKITIMPVFIPIPAEDITKLDYENSHCSSPY